MSKYMPPNSKYKIVIVEDDKAITEMYRFKFEVDGYDVWVAYNGEEGLAAIEKHSPHLVLVDIRMPVMSGDVMIEKLRAKPKTENIKIIVLTNISKDEAPPNLRLLNIDRYIVKAHHTPNQVADIVKKVLQYNL